MTTITQIIPSLGTPPTTADPATFDARADTLLGTALPAMVTAENTWATQANTVAREVNTGAATATTQAGIATDKAVLTAADLVQTGLDRVQTGLDRTSATASATTATTQAGTSTSKAAEAVISANAAAASAIAAAAAVIANISSVTTFTNPLARAVRVAMTASASVGGIQQLSTVNNNFGTGNFSIEFDSVVPTTRPAADIVLDRKHDGTNGYILTLRTTGIVRLQINGTNYDSTVALTSATNVNRKLLVSVVRETTAVAGSVTFYSQGVIVGTAVTITVHPDPATELVTNGTFDTDIAGWDVWGDGSAVFSAGAIEVTTVSFQGVKQTITGLIVGKAYKVSVDKVGGSTGRVRVGSVANPSADNLVNESGLTGGVREVVFIATQTSHGLGLSTQSDVGTTTYDNISIRSFPTATTTAIRYVLGTATTRTEAQFQQSRLRNRALSAAEALDLSIRGPSAADVGTPSARPSQNAKTFDFSSGTDSVSGTNSTVAGNIDGIGGVDNTLRMTATSTSSVRMHLPLNVMAGRTRVNLRLYVPSTNATGTGVRLYSTTNNGAPLVAGDLVQIPANTWTEVSLSVSGDGRQNTWVLYMIDSAGTLNVTSGDLVYLESGGIITALGITTSLSAEDCQSDTGQILDRANSNHALMPASGATRIPRKTEGLVARWTNTWAETHEAQYIGGVNQPILPARAYITSIIGVITSTGGSGVQDVIVGDGSDTDRYVTITTALAAGTQTFTLAANTTDLTNLKLTVDPDANCSMIIAWTITYNILES